MKYLKGKQVVTLLFLISLQAVMLSGCGSSSRRETADSQEVLTENESLVELTSPEETSSVDVSALETESETETETETENETLNPADLSAGTILTEEQVEQIGEDAFFTVEEISDEVFARMWGKSFKEDCTTPREELRYIRCLHKDLEGTIKIGELVMHEVVADKVCEIFHELYQLSYPIESMRLVDDFDADDEASIMVNNTSAFNFRFVDDTTEISNHAYGLAIDINPYYNVYYIPSENYIFPEDGWQYLDRESDFPYKLDPEDDCYRLFTEAGFEWGGWWTYNTDYQHFQYVLN